MLKNKEWRHKSYGLSFHNWAETQESRRCRANTTKCQVLWEEGRCSQSPGLLSMHPCAFCEYLNSLLNFHKHFLSQLMSFFLTHLEHSWPILWITFFSFLYKDPFLPMSSEPFPDSIGDSDLPSTSVPNNHPLLRPLHSLLTSITSTSNRLSLQSHFSQETKFCHFRKVLASSPESDQPSRLRRQALREPLGSLTGRVSCLTPGLRSTI